LKTKIFPKIFGNKAIVLRVVVFFAGLWLVCAYTHRSVRSTRYRTSYSRRIISSSSSFYSFSSGSKQ